MDTEQDSRKYGQYVVPQSQDCVNFGVGQPANSHLPLAEFNNALTKLSQRSNPAILQYGKIDGYSEFKNDFAGYLSKKYDSSVDPDELLMTNGVTGTLSLILSLFQRKDGKKSVIFCENPTYFIALNIFKEIGSGYEIRPIPMGKDGIDLYFFEKELKLHNCNSDNKDHHCFLYTIPINQNPTGYTMHHWARGRLAEIASRNPNLIVLADEVYHLLTFGKVNPDLKPMRYYHDNFVSIGSTSKTFSPALRMGWIHASKHIINQIARSGQLDSSGCMNPIGCAILHELLLNGDLDKVLNRWIDFLGTNCQQLCKIVTEKLGKYIVNLTIPRGGYFLWVRFDKKINVEAMSKTMEDFGVKFHHGNKFVTDSSGSNCMRLSFSWYSGTDYEIGIDRIYNMITSYLSKLEEKQKASPQSLAPQSGLNRFRFNEEYEGVWIHGVTGKLGSLIKKQINHGKKRCADDESDDEENEEIDDDDDNYNYTTTSYSGPYFCGTIGRISDPTVLCRANGCIDRRTSEYIPFMDEKYYRTTPIRPCLKWAWNSFRTHDFDLIGNGSTIIDVTRPEGTASLITALMTHSTFPALIIGTTGDLPMELIESYSKFAPVAIVPNFSRGINEFKKIIGSIKESPSSKKWNVSISESHHVHKVDAPSGTAKLLAKCWDKDFDLAKIRSVREGEIIGIHSLKLSSPGESLEIIHSVEDRQIFAACSLDWMKFVSIQNSRGIVGIFYEIKY